MFIVFIVLFAHMTGPITEENKLEYRSQVWMKNSSLRLFNLDDWPMASGLLLACCWLLLLLPGLLLPGWLAADRWRENYELAADSGFHSSAHLVR